MNLSNLFDRSTRTRLQVGVCSGCGYAPSAHPRWRNLCRGCGNATEARIAKAMESLRVGAGHGELEEERPEDE